MTIKEKIEQNPIISLIVLSLILVSGAIGVMQYFHNKEINIIERQDQLKIDELNSKLSSIKRGIGKSDYFDIRQLFISKDDIKNIPQNLKYFGSDQFYALKKLKGFTYKKYSYPELLKAEKGIDPPEIYKKLYGNQYIHRWASNDKIHVESIEGLDNISPKISVQKLLKKDLRGMLGALFHRVNIGKMLNDYLEKNKLTEGKFDSSDVEKNLENMYDGNWTAILLENYLTQALTIPSLNSNAEYELLNINKVGNLLYVQGLTTLKNVKVNEVKYNTYYLRDELIITSNINEVYTISTSVPSADPSTRDEHFEAVTDWLSNFKMILNN